MKYHFGKLFGTIVDITNEHDITPTHYYFFDKAECRVLHSEDSCLDMLVRREFTLPDDFMRNPVRYLLDHKGRLYCAAHVCNASYAYIVTFSIPTLRERLFKELKLKKEPMVIDIENAPDLCIREDQSGQLRVEERRYEGY